MLFNTFKQNLLLLACTALIEPCQMEQRMKMEIPVKQLAGSDGLDCVKMLEHSVAPIWFRDAQKHRWKPPQFYEDIELAGMKCDGLMDNFIFPTTPLSEEEQNFPLAFAMLVSEDADQVIRLLQAMYWPQNTYCLHIDSKSDKEFKLAICNIASCFPNVVVYPRAASSEVYWGHISVVDAAMGCMKVLTKQRHSWKYLQIVSGTDVPLKTNNEMVQILSIFNGSNDCELQDSDFRRRFTSKWDLIHNNQTSEDPEMLYGSVFPDFHFETNVTHQKGPPPHGLTVYKGSFAATMTRSFVNFLFENQVAIDFYEWLRDTYIPDEFLWPTLIHNNYINAPGEFPGECKRFYASKEKEKPWISRHQVWQTEERCGGTHTHMSCVYGAGDVSILRNSPALIAHKFYRSVQPTARHCLLELHYNRTYFGRADDDLLDMDYYKQLPGVRYQNNPNNFRC